MLIIIEGFLYFFPYDFYSRWISADVHQPSFDKTSLMYLFMRFASSGLAISIAIIGLNDLFRKIPDTSDPWQHQTKYWILFAFFCFMNAFGIFNIIFLESMGDLFSVYDTFYSFRSNPSLSSKDKDLKIQYLLCNLIPTTFGKNQMRQSAQDLFLSQYNITFKNKKPMTPESYNREYEKKCPLGSEGDFYPKMKIDTNSRATQMTTVRLEI